MARFRINNRAIEGDDPTLSDFLAELYESKERPVCLCTPEGVEMYIARVGARYIVKRMPNTGSLHDPACDSYEPPPELSGLGQVMGSAIQENPEEGVTELKFGFSLSKAPGRAPAATGDGAEADSVKTDGNKLTLRGMLHYLWEEAGFNKWAPGMAGKRNWYVIRKYLLHAAEGKAAKGSSLADQIYIPESFSPEHKDAITQRRLAMMSKIAAPPRGVRRLLMLIGEVKEIAPSRYGHKIVVKHLPDCHFMMNEDLHKRLLKRFENELALWDAVDGAHLIVVGTFGVGPTGVSSLEEVALMAVTENWIPFEHIYEKGLLDTLTESGRRFVKGLRYNLHSSIPLASAVLSDTVPHPTALYVIPPAASDDYVQAVEALVAESHLPSWVWAAGAGAMPPIPGVIPVPPAVPVEDALPGIVATCEHGVSTMEACPECEAGADA